MPLLKIAFVSSKLALAEPVPLTVAILMVKSLMRAVFGMTSGNLRLARLEGGGFIYRVRPEDLRLLHVPGSGRAALGAQPAVHAQVLVLDHHAAGLRQAGRDVQRLRQVLR